uniref:Uncharacterized protein n=1 Tax=Anguilla anguilla TaxID=7936 RepID=A0A0E9UCF7_ANGAN
MERGKSSCCPVKTPLDYCMHFSPSFLPVISLGQKHYISLTFSMILLSPLSQLPN